MQDEANGLGAYAAFREWMNGKRQVDAAAALGCSQQTISALMRGKVVPGPLLRVRIQLVAEINANTWPETVSMTAAEIEAMKPLVEDGASTEPAA